MNIKNKIKKQSAVLAVILLILGLLPGVSRAQYSEIITKYLAAMDKNDAVGMEDVVEKNRAAMPAELKALIDSARDPKTDLVTRDEKLFVAESVARVYMEQTGDKTHLILAKRAIFEAKLTPPVSLEAKDGVYTVEMPKPSDHTKNIFKPDNIIIKKGESVKWVNNDVEAHIFSSMPVIGMMGIKAPSVPPGGSFTFKFDKAGDYYYICYIHHAMLGKVTVEGTVEPPQPVEEKPKPKAPAEDPWKTKHKNNDKKPEQPADTLDNKDKKDIKNGAEPVSAKPTTIEAPKDAVGADKGVRAIQDSNRSKPETVKPAPAEEPKGDMKEGSKPSKKKKKKKEVKEDKDSRKP